MTVTVPVPRSRIVETASGFVGETEERFMLAELGQLAPGIAWCGIFTLHVLKVAEALPESIRWIPGVGYANEHLDLMRPGALPAPGDVAYADDHDRHYAIVRDWTIRNGRIWVQTIDGNSAERDDRGRIVRSDLVVENDRPLEFWSHFFDVSKYVELPYA